MKHRHVFLGRTSRWSVLVALVAVLGLVPGAADTATADVDDEVAAVLGEQLDAGGIPGGAVVTVTADGDVRARGVGETSAGDPVTGETPFLIGSTTKSFTALAVMQLVEAGEVDLNAPVTRYVPDFELAAGEAVDSVLVRHLLQHTSGLDDLDGGPILGSGREGTALEAVAEIRDARLASTPGETWRYSNANYALAGLVVEAVSDQTYADYLQQHVLDPLGMADTYVLADPSIAPGQRYWFGFAASSGPLQREGVVAAGYVASTADDLGTYLAMYLREGTAPDGTRILSADGLRTLTAPGPDAHLGPWADGEAAHYAMGWMVGGPWGAERAVFHPGNTPDSTAMIALFPERGLAAATLVPASHELPAPGNPAITDRISRNTMHAVLGEPVPEPIGLWGFYAWFDAVVVALVALALWALVRAVRAYGRPARGRLRRWLRPLPSLVVGLMLVVLPTLVAGGWSVIWTWYPDLALTLHVLTALVAATFGVRLVTSVRGGGRGTSDPARPDADADPDADEPSTSPASAGASA
jgi:CubicO group peptidase (beta-lactamase class C family)